MAKLVSSRTQVGAGGSADHAREIYLRTRQAGEPVDVYIARLRAEYPLLGDGVIAQVRQIANDSYYRAIGLV